MPQILYTQIVVVQIYVDVSRLNNPCWPPTLTLWTQALLQEAHDIEVKKQKEEDKIAKQLAVNRADTATEVQRTIPAGPIMEDLWFKKSNTFLI